MSSQSFADLGVSNAVCTALSERGFDAPFAIQKLVVGDVLAGRDVLAKSPTGSGKTLAFMVPLVDRIEATDRRPAALVLAPTRELATQIVEAAQPLAHARALRIAAVYGGVGLERQAKAAAQSHILVATPGRLEDLLARGAFTLEHVRVLVLDEADRMLDMGFRPAVDRIVKQCPKQRQTLFFSATLDGEAGRIAHEYTQEPRTHEHVPAPEKRGHIEHRFVDVRADRIDLLVDELSTRRDLALVFVRTKRGADRLVKKLGARGVKAVAMHGNKSQNQRERALASFERYDVDVLVATDVAARGIHVDDISHVVNFDPPEDRETYVHRTGRTGRAGRTGTAITFVGGEQLADVGKIARDLGLDDAWQAAGLRPVRTGGGGGHTPGKPQGRAKSAGHRGGGKGRGNGGGGGERGPRTDANDGRKPRNGSGRSGNGNGGARNGNGGGDGSGARTVHSARPSGRGRSRRSASSR
jgi:ATP-dependent RNA helicase RhlE